MKRLLCIILLLGLVACGADPTPFPVDTLPNDVTTPETTVDPSIIRYSLAANTLDAVPDRELIQQAAQLEQLADSINPDDLGTRYDIVAAYGDIPDGIRSPVVPHIALVVQTAFAPLDASELQNVIQQAIDPQKVIDALDIPGATAEPITPANRDTLRADLANAGWPDGLKLHLGSAFAPGVIAIAEQLGLIGINVQVAQLPSDEVQATLNAGDYQLGLIVWTTPEERQIWVDAFGTENVIDLYTAPISYRAIPELTITFTPGGWPIPAR